MWFILQHMRKKFTYLVFAARNCMDLSSWHWNPSLGDLMWGWDSSFLRYFSWVWTNISRYEVTSLETEVTWPSFNTYLSLQCSLQSKSFFLEKIDIFHFIPFRVVLAEHYWIWIAWLCKALALHIMEQSLISHWICPYSSI